MTLHLKFEKVFKITKSCLYLNRSHTMINHGSKLWKLQFFSIMALSFCCFNLLVYSIFVHDIPSGKYAEAIKNSTILILNITVTCKYFVLLYHKDYFINLFNIVNEDYSTAMESSEEEREIVLRYSNRGVRVCKYWFASATATASTFPLKALVLMMYHGWRGEFKLIPMFDLTYPKMVEDYKNSPIFFWTLFMCQLAFDIYNSTVLIGFDPLVPIFLLHTSGQIALLCNKIKKLFTDVKDPKEIEKELKHINIRLQHLYGFVDGLKRNFTYMFEFIMKTTMLLLPLTTFQIVESLRHREVNVEFISFFTGCILHYFIPCYYSDHLMETSENFRQAVYSCGWEKCPDRRVRKTISLMLTRAAHPMGISTIFHVVCLDTFAEMCRQSYGIFNLMNAALV